jgi:hypothetical protein
VTGISAGLSSRDEQLNIRTYEASRKDEWDAFVRTAKNGHFLFYRDYMDYHADRFPDASLMFYDKRDRLIGLLPATARDGVLSSHAGLTFGGVICSTDMKIQLMLELFAAMCERLRGRAIGEVVYKPAPHIYHLAPAQEDLYALFHVGARVVRRDVSAVIDLKSRLPFSKGRGWGFKQAEKNFLEVEECRDFSAFMAIVEDLLLTRHDARPTHSAPELTLLAGRYPDAIRLFVARRNGEMLGGVVVYETRRVARAQYIAATDVGRKLGALDLILEHLICQRYSAKDYFDFGTSTKADGRSLNAGLANNKESYGARAMVCDWYSLDLSGPAVP